MPEVAALCQRLREIFGLVVDDSAANLKLARLLLGTEGYHVRTAEHAPGAEGRPVV